MPALRHVLIADPVAAQRARVAKLVEELAQELAVGLAVHEADDGAEASDLIEAHTPALVVCEVLLPHVNGLELLRRLKADHPDGDHPPVIFVTDMAREADRYWALRNGAHAYVRKPYEDDLLRRRMRKLLVEAHVKPERL
jgi:CheY-like chemotaxis protein